ncbi:MAG: hypothetical protein ACPHQP_05640 [Longimicrobiales bacterium]
MADHLVSLSPLLTRPVILPTPGLQKTVTDHRVNGEPSGARAKKGDRLWVAATGLGVFGAGSISDEPRLMRFESIGELLERVDEFPVQDPPFVRWLIQEFLENDDCEFITVLMVSIHLRVLDQCLEIPERCQTEEIWHELKEGELTAGLGSRVVGPTT